LSTEYVNCKHKLVYVCDLGHQHEICYDKWVQGRRCPTCKAIDFMGAKNPNWREENASTEYCPVWKDKEYKLDLRERDGHKCLNPYCDSKKPSDLVIHHINYDKKDCHFKNLITVCRSCNNKANKDRDWHQSWYQSLLHNRYGYNY